MVATPSTLISRIQHAVDGAATATVASDRVVGGGLLRVHEGTLRILSGRLRLGDVISHEFVECELVPGDYDVVVFVDERKHPTHVHFDVTAPRRT